MRKIIISTFFLCIGQSLSVYSQCGGQTTFTDSRDSKVYNMIQIDGSNGPYCLGSSQCWMAENLNIGTQVAPGVTQTNNGTIEKYCHGGVNLSATEGDCSVSGGLYQWWEAMNYAASVGGNGPGPQGICPLGWHLPTDNEWKCLEMNLSPGLTQVEADATGWRGTNQATQLMQGGSSGFEGRLEGFRTQTGTFGDIGLRGNFWATTETSGTITQFRPLDNTDNRIFRGGNWKDYGFSVRCIRDNAPTPLPIELLYFNARWTDESYETATLEWETITESQNSHFEIERSTDAIDFQYVKSVDGMGNSVQNISYSTLDESPYTNGTSYYRLKQVDYNGDYEYSNIEALNVPEGLNMINLFPNPMVDQLTILLTSSEETETIVSIRNHLGQEVRQFKQRVNKGFNSVEFNLSELSTGNYIIEIMTSSGLYKVERKFVKSKQ